MQNDQRNDPQWDPVEIDTFGPYSIWSFYEADRTGKKVKRFFVKNGGVKAGESSYASYADAKAFLQREASKDDPSGKESKDDPSGQKPDHP